MLHILFLYEFIITDGKYHVVPFSGDLHIHRVDFSDRLSKFVCTVRNAMTGGVESSQPFSLALNGTSSGLSRVA